MLRIFFFLFGFGLMVVGFTYIILYINLFTIGYNFLEYVNFIIRRFECWYLFAGVLIMFLSLPKEDKDEFSIRYFIKF